MLVAAVAVYLGALLFGGALTPAWRDRVMTVMAAGYAEAKWLDAVLPARCRRTRKFSLSRPDATTLCGWRPLSACQRWRWMVVACDAIGDRYLWGKGPKLEQALAAFIREQRVTVLVTQYPITESLYQSLASRYGMPLAGPAQFQDGRP